MILWPSFSVSSSSQFSAVFLFFWGQGISGSSSLLMPSSSFITSTKRSNLESESAGTSQEPSSSDWWCLSPSSLFSNSDVTAQEPLSSDWTHLSPPSLFLTAFPFDLFWIMIDSNVEIKTEFLKELTYTSKPC